jgi:nitrite reductase (NADH) small subunit
MSPTSYTTVCAVDDIEVEGGVTALVAGRAVAVFRTYGGQIRALENYDPFSRASVLARGIVGTAAGSEGSVDFVASPIYKQRFDLGTGRCLDDPTVSVATYHVRIHDGLVQVGGVSS